MSRSIQRILAVATALPLAMGAVSLAPSDAATAASVQPNATCTHPSWSVKDGSTGHALSNGTPARSGPVASCSEEFTVGSSVKLRYNCYVSNSNGYTWTNVTVVGSGLDGWILDGNLSNFGSAYHC